VVGVRVMARSNTHNRGSQTFNQTGQVGVCLGLGGFGLEAALIDREHLLTRYPPLQQPPPGGCGLVVWTCTAHLAWPVKGSGMGRVPCAWATGFQARPSERSTCLAAEPLKPDWFAG